MNCLRIIHNCCKTVEGFKDICLDTHGFQTKMFDTLVSDTLSLFHEGVSKQEWDSVINACSMVSVFIDSFPERSVEF